MLLKWILVLEGQNALMSRALSVISAAVKGPRGCGCCEVAFFPPTKGRETGTCSADIFETIWDVFLDLRKKHGAEGEKDRGCGQGLSLYAVEWAVSSASSKDVAGMPCAIGRLGINFLWLSYRRNVLPHHESGRIGLPDSATRGKNIELLGMGLEVMSWRWRTGIILGALTSWHRDAVRRLIIR